MKMKKTIYLGVFLLLALFCNIGYSQTLNITTDSSTGIIEITPLHPIYNSFLYINDIERDQLIPAIYFRKGYPQSGVLYIMLIYNGSFSLDSNHTIGKLLSHHSIIDIPISISSSKNPLANKKTIIVFFNYENLGLLISCDNPSLTIGGHNFIISNDIINQFKNLKAADLSYNR